jgi:hypothetical protein
MLLSNIYISKCVHLLSFRKAFYLQRIFYVLTKIASYRSSLKFTMKKIILTEQFDLYHGHFKNLYVTPLLLQPKFYL